MTVSIIYHTLFNNNLLIAEKLSESLNNRGDTVSIYPVSTADPSGIPSSDLYIIGSPTQIGILPIKVDLFLRKLDIPKGSLYAVYNTFVTSGSRAPGSIIVTMEECGAVSISYPLLLNVRDLRGPLENGWEAKVLEWSAMLSHLSEHNSLNPGTEGVTREQG